MCTSADASGLQTILIISVASDSFLPVHMQTTFFLLLLLHALQHLCPLWFCGVQKVMAWPWLQVLALCRSGDHHHE